MTVQELVAKIKLWREQLAENENTARYYTAAVIILVGLSAFGLGRLSAIDDTREPVSIEESPATTQPASAASAVAVDSPLSKGVLPSPAGGMSPGGPARTTEVVQSGGKLVASKSGTKYYFPWCGGAARIADANKVWFNSESEARAKGFEPAANCKGLK